MQNMVGAMVMVECYDHYFHGVIRRVNARSGTIMVSLDDNRGMLSCPLSSITFDPITSVGSIRFGVTDTG